MTKKKRITVGILAAVAAVLLGNTTVMAAAKAGEPVFSIETDKTEYSSTDPINETIKIYNASDDILTDIEISGNIPDGYLTEDGISAPEQWKAQIESVDVGETRESTVRLVQKTGSEDSGLSDHIRQAYAQGELTEKEIRECAGRIIALVKKLSEEVQK